MAGWRNAQRRRHPHPAPGGQMMGAGRHRPGSDAAWGDAMRRRLHGSKAVSVKPGKPAQAHGAAASPHKGDKHRQAK
jgi:hypothetical protein